MSLRKNNKNVDLRVINNQHNKIFSVTKLKLIKNFYKKNPKNNKNNLDDFLFDDLLAEKTKIKKSNSINKIETFEFNENVENLKNDKDKRNIKSLNKNHNKKFDLNNDFLIKFSSRNHKKNLDSNFKNVKCLISENSNQIKSFSENNSNKTNDENFYVDEKVDSENSFDCRVYDEKKVQKLDEWEKQKLIDAQRQKSNLKNKELESLNRMNEIRENLSRIDKKNMTNLLYDFYKKNEIEQGTILMSNINLGKKSFNFDIFTNNFNGDEKNLSEYNYYNLNGQNVSNLKLNLNKGLINSSYFNKSSGDKEIMSYSQSSFSNNINKLLDRPKTQNAFKPTERILTTRNKIYSSLTNKKSISRDAIRNKNLNDFIETKNLIKEINKKKEEDFFRSNDIKIEGDIVILSNIDMYRKVIREKTELENTYRKELLSVAQQIHKKKIQKEKFNRDCVNCANNLQKIRNEFRDKKDAVEAQRKELDKILGTKMNFLNTSTSMELSQLSKDSPIRLRKEERLQQIFELQKMIQQNDQDLYSLNKEYENAKTKYLNSIQDKKVIIKTIDDELKELKINMNNLLDDQKKYLFDILKKGIDTRRDGLTWVIKRLIEINAQLDYSVFPRFLDHSQIDYLLEISYRLIECYQLKLIFKALKKIQKKHPEEKNHSINDNLELKSVNLSAKKNGQLNINFSSKQRKTSVFYNVSFSEKLIKVFENISKNNQKLTKNSNENKIDDLEILNIVSNLKKKLLNFDEKEKIEKNEQDLKDYIFSEDEMLLNYFQENHNQREYFEEILLLRDKIIQMDNEIKSQIENFKKNFKKRNINNNKNANAKTIQYDLVYSALFGNGIIT